MANDILEHLTLLLFRGFGEKAGLCKWSVAQALKSGKYLWCPISIRY